MSWKKGAAWPRLGRTNPTLTITPRGKNATFRGEKMNELLARIKRAGAKGLALREAARDIPDRWRVRELLQEKLVQARGGDKLAAEPKAKATGPAAIVARTATGRLLEKSTVHIQPMTRQELFGLIDRGVLEGLRKAGRP